jgi:protocatechuate 3,4-dioxygenase beta subunit
MMIMAPPQLRDFTSDDGTFTLEGVPAGGVVLVASSPGYSAGRLNLTVEEGKTVSNVELQLDTGTKLIGRVTGSNGSPLADVQVRVMPSPSGGFAASGMERSTTTDSNGEYSIEALEGEESVLFSHVKHSPARKSVTLKGRETRLDVQLSSGQRITGTVVTESGAPVADAEVEAFSSGSFVSARTNASGAFELETASPGRYRFSANKAGFAEGTFDDFDISSGAPVRITLRTGGTIYGRVTGLTPQELTEAFVDARSPTSSARGTVDANGNYRIEGVAAGTVTVRAMAGAGMSGSARQSAPQTVDLAAGGSHQLDIAFRGDIVISGRVLRNGAPIPGASVNFYPRGTSARSSGMSPTDEQGRYSVSGLEEGEYNVTVGDRMAPYSTTYQVRGTATYDVEYKTAPLRGRVLDVSTNEPLANVAVQLRSTSQSDGYRTGRGAVTDAAGSFVLDSVPPGSYTVTASKDGFGNEIKEVLVGDSAAPELEMHLSHNEDMVLSVVDARDGRAISARASVYDMQGRLVNEPRMMFGGGGEPADVKLSLSPGSYTASISANGYATRNIRFQAPSKQTVQLSPGGTLLVKSKHSARVRVRFIDSMGLPYPRFSNFPPTRELVPSPGTTTMSNMAAGTYTMQLLGENDVVLESKQVVIAEAQTVTEEL